ncbi:tRNA (adenine(22)-N(1))-methyltransferase [Youxingia wuxianensis]|uniref:SAM-dependent methyltransferase n=1 Tax=Youxingia wuxianensis TaxID=2763678 RepID=A0A926EQ78_9FIRM|nr:class I SAM-dependent methyltransferase [Youxingia wuxianensis]MBC8586148.1 SAM-dependent methyltransferase [Youxingia wuxianensis]
MAGPLPKLDDRLAVIASMVRDGSRLADIGTDHGYLIAWLAAKGKILSGYACDINRQPLEKAAFSLSACGVTEKVSLVLADGLHGISGEMVDDIVLAGMGGELIWEIISGVDWTRDQRLRFILQPMTKVQRLRKLLYENGFEIRREQAVISGNFPYTVMEAQYTGDCRQVSLRFAYTGLLWEQETEAAKAYIEKQERLLREKVKGLRGARGQSDQLQIYERLLQELEERTNGYSKRSIPGD